MTIILRLQSILMLICLAIIVSAQTCLAQCSATDRLCGPKCLLVVCQKLGIDTTLEGITTLSSYELKSGTSMAGLYSAAKAKGLEAAGMKISIDELMTLDMPVIAHLWNSHFAVVERGENGDLLVTDPPGDPRAVTKEDFQKIYSGFALLVAKDSSKFPTATSSGPDLRLSRYVCDVGAVEDGSLIEQTVTCRNEGSQSLTISGIDASTTSLQGFADQQTVPPGGNVNINAVLDTATVRTGQQQTLYIHSNDPVSPIVQLQVWAEVEPAGVVFSPRVVNFGTMRKSEHAGREVFLPKSKLRDVQISKVVCDNPFVTAGIGEKTDGSGNLVTVSLSPDVPVGELIGTVSIYTNHPKDPKVDVPVSGIIKGDIEVFPDTLFFGMLKPGCGGRKQITISTVSDQPFEIVKIDNPLSNLLVRATPKAEGKGYTLIATLLRDTPAGYIKDEIVVHTNDPNQPQIRIPVYAMVEK